MYIVLPMITNVSYSSHDVANKLLIWCLTIITHSAPYEILGDVYFVVLENWLRLMTFWHKSTTPMMFTVVPTSSLTVFRHLHMGFFGISKYVISKRFTINLYFIYLA